MFGEYNRYIYDGPVMEFGKMITDRWRGETCAASPTKAKSNLVYQFKKQNNRIPGSKITLPGKVIAVE